MTKPHGIGCDEVQSSHAPCASRHVSGVKPVFATPPGHELGGLLPGGIAGRNVDYVSLLKTRRA